MFQDRADAGKQQALRLKKFQGEAVVIMAVPRGGVPVAYQVAKQYGWPVDLMLAKKLGHPVHKEYAIGAVGLEERIIAPHPDVSEAYIESETRLIRERLTKMWQWFMGGRHPEQVQGKTVIVVDDGIATGRTLLAAVQVLRHQQPAKIVVAAPIASAGAVEDLALEADEVVVVETPERFRGVGEFYKDFTQVSDEEVFEDLGKLRGMGSSGKA